MHVLKHLPLVLLAFSPWLANAAAHGADERTVGVFVALCDNVHQGIVPVPKAVGDGDDPEHNLYWGCADGFMGVFGKSGHWKKESAPEAPSADVLRTYGGLHDSGKMTLTAFAYRGSAIETCMKDFMSAVAGGKYDLVVYLGHNGLMDFYLDGTPPDPDRRKKPECMVLCCKSQAYFCKHIAHMDATPVLLTTQFMYPGAFILHDVLEEWIKGSGIKAYRAAAGRAYAANQKIAVGPATGVFADLDRLPPAGRATDTVIPLDEAAAARAPELRLKPRMMDGAAGKPADLR